MKEIENQANQIAGMIVDDGEDEAVFFDLATILLIISIITAVYRLWKECNKKPLEALAEAKNPGIVARWRLRRLVRQNVDDEEFNNRYARKITNNILKYGLSLNEEKIKLSYMEV